MKTFILGFAICILLSISGAFGFDNDEYHLAQDRYKAVANDAADAAALFYDQEAFAEGIKVFNKTEGNKAVKDIIKSGLNLNDSLSGGIVKYAEGVHTYYTYYFDEDGKMTKYHEDTLISTTDVEYPYVFKESLTDYTSKITKPTVIVTISAGKFDFRLKTIDDPELIRTSGYEYVGY